MNYPLNKPEHQQKKGSLSSAFKALAVWNDEKRNLTVAFVAIAISVLTLLSPVIISHTIDTYIRIKIFMVFWYLRRSFLLLILPSLFQVIPRQKQWEASAEERFSVCEMPFLQSCRSYPLLFSIKIKQEILFPGSTTIPIF